MMLPDQKRNYCTGRWPCGCGVKTIAIQRRDLYSACCAECQTGRTAALPPDPDILDEAWEIVDLSLAQYIQRNKPGKGWLHLRATEVEQYAADGDVGKMIDWARSLR